jgi:hypothetical protein
MLCAVYFFIFRSKFWRGHSSEHNILHYQNDVILLQKQGSWLAKLKLGSRTGELRRYNLGKKRKEETSIMAIK